MFVAWYPNAIPSTPGAKPPPNWVDVNSNLFQSFGRIETLFEATLNKTSDDGLARILKILPIVGVASIIATLPFVEFVCITLLPSYATCKDEGPVGPVAPVAPVDPVTPV